MLCRRGDPTLQRRELPRILEFKDLLHLPVCRLCFLAEGWSTIVFDRQRRQLGCSKTTPHFAHSSNKQYKTKKFKEATSIHNGKGTEQTICFSRWPGGLHVEELLVIG